MNWLFFDFGPHYGDNFRGFLFLKALKGKFPDIRFTCWMTPDSSKGLQGLRSHFDFLDYFLIQERTPRETYLFNFATLKKLIQDGKQFSMENFPGGFGPDGKYYEKIIPNAEPWMTMKLIRGEALGAPDSMNQGEFMQRILQLSAEDLISAYPLFGQRVAVENYICVGLCRPYENDRKQPSRAKIDRIWNRLLESESRILALDYQDWYCLPRVPRVEDWRRRSWVEKVPVLNRALLFIGMDGGLNHFAAACGCPTRSFFGERHGPDWGERVGPYPRRTPFGEHRGYTRFEDFLQAIKEDLSRTPLNPGNPGRMGKIDIKARSSLPGSLNAGAADPCRMR
jgi:hypothetical protein